MGKEQRRHARVTPRLCTAQARLPGLFGRIAGNLCLRLVDISESGACLLLSRPLHENQELRVHLRLGPYEDAFDVAGLVRRCSPWEGDPDRYLTGIAFIDPPIVLKMCVRSLLHPVAKHVRNAS